MSQNEFDSIRKTLASKTVGIAGAGGLGSNCAMALARSGIGKMIVVDFDIINFSNLNRQYYFHNQLGKKKVLALKENVQLVYPEVNVLPLAVRLEAHHVTPIFKSCDIIVEALDLKETKHLFIETALQELPHIPLVAASGMAGWGANNLLRTESIGNFHVCGDQETEVSDELPPLAPRVGIVAMMQANLILELLLGLKEMGGSK